MIKDQAFYIKVDHKMYDLNDVEDEERILLLIKKIAEIERQGNHIEMRVLKEGLEQWLEEENQQLVQRLAHKNGYQIKKIGNDLHIVEGAIRFSGIPESEKEQPPVRDKEGKLLNLNDPQWPVVKGQKFTYYYWKMPKTPKALLKYLTEHWEYFNKTRFGGILKPPQIRLMKDVDARNMRHRGKCRYGVPCVIFVSPNLFNAPHEGWVNNTLIHEMCHQAVYEDWYYRSSRDIRTLETGEAGHGPLWKEWMTKVGLTPSRYDLTGNDTYMDEKETHRDEAYKDALEKKLYIMGRLARTGSVASFHDSTGELQICVVVGRSTRKKGFWVVITKPSVFSFTLVKDKLLLTAPEGFDKDYYTNTDQQPWYKTIAKLIDQGVAERVSSSL